MAGPPGSWQGKGDGAALGCPPLEKSSLPRSPAPPLPCASGAGGVSPAPTSSAGSNPMWTAISRNLMSVSIHQL